MKYIDTERVVIKSWCNNPEENALAQARNLANLPFVFRQVCLMPDTHEGDGMPIGGVIATQGAVIPNAVGVDIGCGMLAMQTSLREIDLAALKRIVGTMRKTIPESKTGVSNYGKDTYTMMMDQKLAENISAKGDGLGLQKVLYEQLVNKNLQKTIREGKNILK